MRTVIKIAMLMLIALPAWAQTSYDIVPDQSVITFSGTHAGNYFEGVFHQWRGDIVFDPDHLTESYIEATFEMNSAETGNKMYDGTLPKKDWFHTEQYPTAHFISNAITRHPDHEGYIAKGNLTIRDITEPIIVPFTIDALEADPVTATATAKIDRLKYDIGRQSDPDGQWVSKTINIKIELTARPH